MEEILKIHREYVRHLPWKTIGRYLAVVLSILLLAACAGLGSERYVETVLSGQNVSSVYANVISGSILDTSSAFTKMNIRTFPSGELCLPEFSFRFKNTEKTSNLKLPEAAETQPLSPEAASHTTAGESNIKNTAVYGETSFSVQDTSGSISDKAGDTITAAVKVPMDATHTESDTPPKAAAATITVTAYGNEGMPETTEMTVSSDTFSMDMLETPARLGKMFDGWYLDSECTIPFSETDVASGIENGLGCLPLYAGWKEFPGFLSNDLGYITGCTADAGTVTDGFLTFPVCESCTGITKGAFDNIADCVFEIYIPDCITYIEEGAFDSMYNLMYIEVSAGNPVYYSEKGILYYHDGTEAAYPMGRRLLLE